MNYRLVTDTLLDFTNKTLAKSIVNFFIWQHKEACIEAVNRRCEYNAMVSANKAAEYEYQQSQELGWGALLPYSEIRITNAKKQMEDAITNQNDAKALLDFVTNTLIDKFVE